MRILAVILAAVAAFPAAAETPRGPDAVPFRLYVHDTFRVWSKLLPQDRGPLWEYCRSEEEIMRDHPGEEVWLGAAAHCVADGELDSDYGGTRLAACEYYIKAERHYVKARVKPEEAEALRLSIEEVKAGIAALEC